MSGEAKTEDWLKAHEANDFDSKFVSDALNDIYANIKKAETALITEGKVLGAHLVEFKTDLEAMISKYFGFKAEPTVGNGLATTGEASTEETGA